MNFIDNNNDDNNNDNNDNIHHNDNIINNNSNISYNNTCTINLEFPLSYQLYTPLTYSFITFIPKKDYNNISIQKLPQNQIYDNINITKKYTQF